MGAGESNSNPAQWGQHGHTLTSDSPPSLAMGPGGWCLRTQFRPNPPLMEEVAPLGRGRGSPTAAVGLCLGQQVAEGVEELFQPRLVPHALLDHLLLAQVLGAALDGQGLRGLNTELGQVASGAWGRRGQGAQGTESQGVRGWEHNSWVSGSRGWGPGLPGGRGRSLASWVQERG